MTFSQQLLVDKDTQGSADTFRAVGLAYLCRAMVGGNVIIEDYGPCYSVRPSRPVKEAQALTNAAALDLIPPLLTQKQLEHLVKRGHERLSGFDLDAQRNKQQYYATLYKQLPRQLRRRGAILRIEEEGFEGLQAIALEEPHPALSVYGAINAFKVAASFNAVVLAWQELDPAVRHELAAMLLRAFATTPNNLTGLQAELSDLHRRHGLEIPVMVTQLQIVNPMAGKGTNNEKAQGVRMSNMDEPWPLALLKLVGYYRLAVPLPIRAGDRTDYKAYVLRPRRVTTAFIDTVIPTYRRVLWSTTAIKADILASLSFVEVLVRQKQRRVAIERNMEEDQDDDPMLTRVTRVTMIAEGFDVTFSKSFANAVATMNLAVIGLPTWLPDITGGSLADAAKLLDEHIAVVEAIGARSPGERRDETTEEVNLLQLYRDFLSTARGETLLEFTASYAPYLMSQISRQRYVALFSIPQLEVLMTRTQQPHSYTEIVIAPGFRSLAYCIREATINIQFGKGEKKEQKNEQRRQRAALYEVRYGLSQDLLRAAKDDGSFIEALSEFVQSYCAENARVFERLRAQSRDGGAPASLLRRRPSEDDLAEVVGLVQSHGAGIVCRLLLAFGYARRSNIRSGGEADTDTSDPINEPDEALVVDNV